MELGRSIVEVLMGIARTVSIVVAVSGVALAAPGGDAKTAALLDKGRQLEAHGKHAEAIAAFEAYLATRPDDPVANAELGYAAYEAKDYAKAEAADRLAIAHAPPPTFHGDSTGNTRGAALYNLGLVQEARGEPADAAVSYGESLAARGSRVVRERLQKLDAARAAMLDPLAPARIPGPFATLRDACRDTLVREGMSPDENWGDHSTCTNFDQSDMLKLAAPATLADPFTDVVAFQLIDRSALDLAVRTREGWFVYEYANQGNRNPGHCGGTQFTVTPRGVATRAVPELRIDYRSTGDCSHDGNGHSREWGWDERGTIVIGIGASGRPAATPVIVTALRDSSQFDADPKVETERVAVTLAWKRDGSLDVAGKVGADVMEPDAVMAEDLLGHHLLAFP